MAKLMTFVMTASVLMLLLYLIGINTTAGYIIQTLGMADNPTDFKSGPLWIAVSIGLTGLVAVGGIRIAGFGLEISSIAIAAVLAGVLGEFIGDFVSLLTVANASCPSGDSCRWVYWVVVVVMVPIILGYAISLFDWARGID